MDFQNSEFEVGCSCMAIAFNHHKAQDSLTQNKSRSCENEMSVCVYMLHSAAFPAVVPAPLIPSISASYTLAPARSCYSRKVQRLPTIQKQRIIIHQGQSNHASCTPAPWPHTHVWSPKTPMGIMEGKKKKNFVLNHIWVGENEHGVLISRI